MTGRRESLAIGIAGISIILMLKNFGNVLGNPTDAVLMSLFLVCLGGGLSSLFFSALLHGAADVVRLLKRSNNLPYSGDILL